MTAISGFAGLIKCNEKCVRPALAENATEIEIEGLQSISQVLNYLQMKMPDEC